MSHVLAASLLLGLSVLSAVIVIGWALATDKSYMKRYRDEERDS